MVEIWRNEKYIRKEGFTKKKDLKHKYLKTEVLNRNKENIERMSE